MTDRECSKWNQVCADAVWPVISEALGGGDIEVTGGVFDQQCDIDAVQKVHVGLRSLNLRIQWDKPGYDEFETFTVRYQCASGKPTEHHKIMAALDNGAMISDIRVHCYTSRPRGLGFVKRIAVARTLDLGRYIKWYNYERIVPLHDEDGKQFGVVSWRSMMNMEFPVLIWLGGTSTSPPRMKDYCRQWDDEFVFGSRPTVHIHRFSKKSSNLVGVQVEA